MKTKHIVILLLLLLFSACNFFKSSPEKNGDDQKTDIRKKVRITLSESSPGHEYIERSRDSDIIGYIVYDLAAGKVLCSHNPHETFIPASTEKLMTILNSFKILGVDHRFSTYVYYDGKIEGNELNGNLYLKGGGDPYLKVADLTQIIGEIKSRGIQKVNGSFFFDQSFLPATEVLDRTMNLDEGYNCGISALSLDQNTITAHWHTPRGDKNPKITLTPDLPVIAAGIRDGRSEKHRKKEERDTNLFFHEYVKNESMWELSPEARPYGRHKIPVRRAALYTASFFQKLAAIQGLKLPAPEEGRVPSKGKLLIDYKGSRITDVADTTLTFSVNMMAELLFLCSARKINPEAVSYRSAAETMEKYTMESFPLIHWDGFNLSNGSGLSSRDRITPEQMMAYLIWADKIRIRGKKFMYYLGPSGWGWSLRNRFIDPKYAFHIFAKTGTISYSVALSGYLYSASGKKLAFCFFCSDKKLRREYEDDPDRMRRKVQKAAQHWNNVHQSEMDHIIERWIDTI